MARAAVELRARQLLSLFGNEGKRRRFEKNEDGARSGEIREGRFTAFDGKLVGRPDVIRQDEIVDYKSGSVVELDEATQSEVVKAAYVRQLRIYGYLVRQALGRWVARGVLLPLVGAGIQVDLAPADCGARSDAVAMLEGYNAKIHTTHEAMGLATPTATNCKWCSFKLMCPAFWQAVSPTWSGLLVGASVEGALVGSVRWIHDGAAAAVTVELDGGTELRHRTEIAPLNASVHTCVTRMNAGDRVRLVNLRVRSDAKLVPALRTVVSRVAELPSIQPCQ